MTISTSTLIEVNGPQVHTLPASDQDCYSFRTLEIQDVVITTRGSSGDTVITLYNESRAQISTEDDGGSGDFARLEERSLPPGTYYFESPTERPVQPVFTLLRSSPRHRFAQDQLASLQPWMVKQSG